MGKVWLGVLAIIIVAFGFLLIIGSALFFAFVVLRGKRHPVRGLDVLAPQIDARYP